MLYTFRLHSSVTCFQLSTSLHKIWNGNLPLQPTPTTPTTRLSRVISHPLLTNLKRKTQSRKMNSSYPYYMHVEGACGFGDLHKTRYGKYSVGLSEMLFDRGSTCGACFEVKCVDQWCLQGGPPIALTAADYCPPNYGLPADKGGWCNFPRAHFQIPASSFSLIAHLKAEVIQIQYRR